MLESSRKVIVRELRAWLHLANKSLIFGAVGSRALCLQMMFLPSAMRFDAGEKYDLVEEICMPANSMIAKEKEMRAWSSSRGRLRQAWILSSMKSIAIKRTRFWMRTSSLKSCVTNKLSQSMCRCRREKIRKIYFWRVQGFSFKAYRDFLILSTKIQGT